MSKDLISSRDIEVAKQKTKKGLKSAFAIGCYNSETDNEIGRSKEHAKHMRRTRRSNFAKKMKLIDPNYGKKAAGILAAGAVLGVAATTVPTVGAALGPTVGGAVIAGGLAYLETDAHRSVGDHAILDSLLDDRDDNWRTNTTLDGYNGHGDTISEFDKQQMLAWSDSDSDDLDTLLPSTMLEQKMEMQENLNSSNPLFDALSDNNNSTPNSPIIDLFGDMDLSDSQSSINIQKSNSSIPRPPSPSLESQGTGERYTNPHSSSVLQGIGNDYQPEKQNQQNTNNINNDDFFASLSSSNVIQPSNNSSQETFDSLFSQGNQQINITNNQQNNNNNDLFAAFSSSEEIVSSPPKVNNNNNNNSSNNNNSGSFFATVASAIPSSPNSNNNLNTQSSNDNNDPFADLYSRPASNQSSSNYSALQGMNRF